MVVPFAPQLRDWRDLSGDWRTGASFNTPAVNRQPRGATGMASSYTDLLPADIAAKPAFSGSTNNAFWNQMLGSQQVNEVVNIFGGQGVGKVATKPTYGAFARTPGVDNEILAAAQQYGVPANFLKAILAREGSGDWAANNRYSNIRPEMGRLLPYVGVFEQTANRRGLSGLWNQAAGNRAVQIQLLAGVLRSQYDQLRKQNPQYGWTNVGTYHFSGNAVPQGYTDELGMTDSRYTNSLLADWKMLDAYAGNQWNNYTSPSAQPSTTGTLSSIFGGSVPRVSQKFGITDFSQSGLGQSMYGYAGNYGVQGHAGVDYSMNTGNKLYTPVGGTVIRAGGSGYYTDSRYGNRAGTGELRIKLDNGDELILGHMQQINPKVGTRINAGDLVGLSGTNNGGHVHVEYRQYKPGATSSGYLAVDPSNVFRGALTAPSQPTPVSSGQTATGSVPKYGAGLAAARAASGSIKNADIPRLVYDDAFKQTALMRALQLAA